MRLKILILTVLAVSSFSCARSYLVRTESSKMSIVQVNMIAVQYHRPAYAKPDQDDFSVKDRKVECQSAGGLWADVLKNQSEVRTCLNSIASGMATYFYVPAAQPYLELDLEEETNPKCLKAALPKIPLPREIYYLGLEDGRNFEGPEAMGCFASSFSTDTNQLMKTPTGFLKKKIALPFPVSRELNSEKDLSLWFMVTVFNILKSDERAEGKLWATPVPETLCRACFKNDRLFEDKYSGKMKPVFWP